MSNRRAFLFRNEGYQMALMYYYPEEKRFEVHINHNAPQSELPGTLGIPTFYAIYDLDSEQSLSFVQARICPPGRHNISSILRNAKLKEYDEFGILLYNEGRSTVDDMWMEEVSASKAADLMAAFQ